MRRTHALLVSCFFFSLVAAGQVPTRIAIRAGRLIDGKSEKPLENVLIQVEGDKVCPSPLGELRQPAFR